MNLRTAYDRFVDLHREGTFVMPNPHDLGACRILTTLGFPALATTSAGFAASLGQLDMSVTREQLVEHARSICSATHLPVNVDSEQCYPDAPGGVEATIEMLAEVGAAGCSLEDWNPRDGRIEPIDVAAERIARAAAVADRVGIVLTARAENHIRGVDDFADTKARLKRYAEAGAKVLYAPGLTKAPMIAEVVALTATPINVLMLPGGPTVRELTDLGVRRISLGSSLSNIAYGAFVKAAQRLLDEGELPADEPFLPRNLATRAFVKPVYEPRGPS
jgi:2-methylisocitrate lyase-like PEP mutase family enzyme